MAAGKIVVHPDIVPLGRQQLYRVRSDVSRPTHDKYLHEHPLLKYDEHNEKSGKLVVCVN
jgi:hypothetical protein